MSIFELFLVAVGLSMDAFAVSICQGLSSRKFKLKSALIIGLYFGIFQAAMPLIGYVIGAQFAEQITTFDHWIAFILLGLIGGKMIKDSFECESYEIESTNQLGIKKMLPLAIATSIDALAVGLSFAFLNVNILPASSIIGITTCILSMIGFKIGILFGTKYKSKAEFAGGLILILIGLKILLEHLGIF